MPKKANKKNKRGFARIEFLAVEPEVKELLEKGHTIQSAYDEFFEAERISMSYAMFRRYTIDGVTTITRQKKLKKQTQQRIQQADIRNDDNLSIESNVSKRKPLGITSNTGFKGIAKEAEDDDIY